MTNLLDVVRREPVPIPWAEGDNIPWNDPDFSRRMLAEHLTQDHGAASRQFTTIDEHVNWIHEKVLNGMPSRILDLGCGPGLYTSRLADLGHDAWGIDFSPASVEHANRTTSLEHYLGDVRQTSFGQNNDLVMMLYGEINAFKPSDFADILQRARESLTARGRILLEPHTLEAVEQMGSGLRTWRTRESGLFSDRPHLYLEECFWDSEQATATVRYIIVDAATSEVTRYAQSVCYYGGDMLEEILNRAGLRATLTAPSLTGNAGSGSDFNVVVAEPL